MIGHHPDEDLLLAYASGAADEARALVVATHLAFCAPCRDAVTLMEKLGGGLLEAIAPVAVSDGALDRALSKLDAAAPFERPRRAASRDNTPAPLRHYLGGDLRDVRWRRMGPHLAYAPLFRQGDVKVRLLRGTPGTDAGRHSHRGLEYTLVLQGGYTDHTGSYGPGDLQVADAGVRHSPIADPGEDCINLAVTTAPLAFENLIQKIAGPLFGF
jgi:putative transcriptional regulator